MEIFDNEAANGYPVDKDFIKEIQNLTEKLINVINKENFNPVVTIEACMNIMCNVSLLYSKHITNVSDSDPLKNMLKGLESLYKYKKNNFNLRRN